MRKYLYIAAGGAAGAILRYLIHETKIGQHSGSIPATTLFINTLGCFLLAFIITAALEILELDSDLRLGVTTGLLGAFTTFSTLCKETAVLINGGFLLSAVLYIVIATVLALFAVYYGTVLARKIFAGRTAGKKRGASAGGGSGEDGGQ